MKIKTILVTPKIAEKMLSSNTHNRPVYQLTVDCYARDMRLGLWKPNNQGIGFDVNGVLIDGQHRLLAIIQSGVTLEMIVVTDLPVESQTTVDAGKARGVGDNLHLIGEDNGNVRAAIVRGLFLICSGYSHLGKMSFGMISKAMDIYRKEIDAIIENKSSIRALLYTPTLSGFVFAAKCYFNEVIDFEKKYFNGENLSKGDPILALRNYMLNRNENPRRGEASRIIVAQNTLTCIMHHITQNNISVVRHTLSGQDFFYNKQKSTINKMNELLGRNH